MSWNGKRRRSATSKRRFRPRPKVAVSTPRPILCATPERFGLRRLACQCRNWRKCWAMTTTGPRNSITLDIRRAISSGSRTRSRKGESAHEVQKEPPATVSFRAEMAENLVGERGFEERKRDGEGE